MSAYPHFPLFVLSRRPEGAKLALRVGAILIASADLAPPDTRMVVICDLALADPEPQILGATFLLFVASWREVARAHGYRWALGVLGPEGEGFEGLRALAERSPPPRPIFEQAWLGLSEVEREVVVARASGLSTREVAEQRGVSSRTIEAQMRSVGDWFGPHLPLTAFGLVRVGAMPAPRSFRRGEFLDRWRGLSDGEREVLTQLLQRSYREVAVLRRVNSSTIGTQRARALAKLGFGGGMQRFAAAAAWAGVHPGLGPRAC